MFDSERLLNDWRCEQGCGGFGGTHFTTLTDTRLLTRYEECICCSCCCDPAHIDSSTFLYDIAQLLETTEARGCLQNLFAVCCFWYACCCPSSKVLQARGSFGHQTLYLSAIDVSAAKPAIAAAIARRKPANKY